MSDAVQQFGSLTGKSVVRQPSILDGLFEQYRRWLDRTPGCRLLYPQGGLNVIFDSSFDVAQRMVKDFTIRSADVAEFVQRLHAEEGKYKEHPQHKHAGVFVNGLISRAGRGYYDLTDLPQPINVGNGIEGVVLEADSFQYEYGSNVSYVECRTDLPKEPPAKGMILVGEVFESYMGHNAQEFVAYGGHFRKEAGHNAENVIVYNGSFSDRVFWNAERVEIHNGRFGDDAAHNVQNIIIYGGRFGEKLGQGARHITIYDGSFGEKTGRYAQKMDIHGGTFLEDVGLCARHVVFRGGKYKSYGWTKQGSPPWILKENEGEKNGQKDILGKVINYRKDVLGEVVRCRIGDDVGWKIVPHS